MFFCVIKCEEVHFNYRMQAMRRPLSSAGILKTSLSIRTGHIAKCPYIAKMVLCMSENDGLVLRIMFVCVLHEGRYFSEMRSDGSIVIELKRPAGFF